MNPIRTRLGIALSVCVCSAFGYETNTHEAINRIAIRNTKCVADAYLKNELDITLGLSQQYQGWSMAGWCMEGGIREDDGVPSNPFSLLRYFRHFYDPTRDGGLSDVPFNRTPYTRSLIWGYDHPDNEWSFRKARTKFLQSLISTTPSVRTKNLAETFKALGMVGHLIGDLAQPQHTRNDAHPTNAGIEKFASRFYGTSTQIEQNFDRISMNDDLSFEVDYLLPDFENAQISFWNDERLIGIPKVFKCLWDTDQYEGQADFSGFSDRYSPGLSEVSNFYCVTDDTMFTGDEGLRFLSTGLKVWLPKIEASNKHFFRYPTLAYTTFDRMGAAPYNMGYLELERDGEDAGGQDFRFDAANPAEFGFNLSDLFCGVKFYRQSPGSSIGRATLGIGAATFQSYVQFLLPKAITYETYLFNYFFRARLGVQLSNAADDRISATIKNLTGETISSGTWLVYAEYASGNRYPIARATFNWERNMPNNHSFSASWDKDYFATKYVVILCGKVGDEWTAVGAKVVDAP